MMDITDIICAMLTILASIITVIVIPYIKAKTTETQRNRITEYVKVAVQAAEQLFPNLDGEKMGDEKLKYVAEFLESKGITFDVDDVTDEIRLMIEGAVKEFTE